MTSPIAHGPGGIFVAAGNLTLAFSDLSNLQELDFVPTGIGGVFMHEAFDLLFSGSMEDDRGVFKGSVGGKSYFILRRIPEKLAFEYTLALTRSNNDFVKLEGKGSADLLTGEMAQIVHGSCKILSGTGSQAGIDGSGVIIDQFDIDQDRRPKTGTLSFRLLFTYPSVISPVPSVGAETG